MKTDSEEFIKTRRTRLELLEERISRAEKLIEDLKLEFKEEDVKEMNKLQNILLDLRDMKHNLLKVEAEDNINLAQKIKQLTENSLLILNNHKVEIANENEKLKLEKEKNNDYIRKLEQDIIKKNFEMESAKKKENQLNEINSSLEENLRIFKSKAYGYDIAKKFEIYQNKLNNEKFNKMNIDPNKNKNIEDEYLAFSLWEKQYNKNISYPTKLDDIARHNGLWIGNSQSNVEKLLYEIDSSNKREKYSYNNSNTSINTNMRKYSPMIINNQIG